MSGIITVQPRVIAEYRAAQWDGNPSGTETVKALVTSVGASVSGKTSVTRRGKTVSALLVLGRNNRRYKIAEGEWIVALGNNGVLRTLTPTQFKHDYRQDTQ